MTGMHLKIIDMFPYSAQKNKTKATLKKKKKNWGGGGGVGALNSSLSKKISIHFQTVHLFKVASSFIELTVYQF